MLCQHVGAEQPQQQRAEREPEKRQLHVADIAQEGFAGNGNYIAEVGHLGIHVGDHKVVVLQLPLAEQLR